MGCPECGATLNSRLLPQFMDNLIGIGRPVCLVNSVVEEHCGKCGHTQRTIPDLDGLIAAIAVSRAFHPLKLRGEELRFMRKALEVTAKDFANIVGVTSETMSRWENNREPITPTSEKLLRFIVAGMLRDRAPAIGFDIKEIAEMRILPVCPDGDRPPLCFERTKLRFEDVKKPVEEHWGNLKEAA